MSKNETSPLRMAVMQGNLDLVRDAIKKGEKLNDLDRDGRTVLFLAIVNGSLAIASELIENGAEINAKDKQLETPLHFAAREHRTEIVALLLKRGAQIDAQDTWGNTPLWRAVMTSNGRGETIKLLVAHGANKGLKNKSGYSPEDIATDNADPRIKTFMQ